MDRPIIFSAPMVRALLDGRKTMTRRLAWKEPRDPSTGRIADSYQRPTPWQKAAAGDRLYVRESISRSGALIGYVAGGPTCHHVWPENWKQDPRPSIHMPRWASRLTLIVTATKIEKLQTINGIDALAEGITRVEGETPWRTFKHLWESIHGFEGWDSNPEVVALTFTVHKANIDQMKEAA